MESVNNSLLHALSALETGDIRSVDPQHGSLQVPDRLSVFVAFLSARETLRRTGLDRQPAKPK
jgi:hypothetical protein